MNNDYNRIETETLLEFVEGETHDIYQFIKKHCYKDLYMSIYDYCFSKLHIDDNLDRFIRITLYTYKLQNRLNQCLKVTDGKYFDNYLMHCVVKEVLNRFKNAKAIDTETEETYHQKVVEAEQKSLEHNLISEYNISILTGQIRSKFDLKNNFSIEDVISFIEQLNPIQNENEVNVPDFLSYFNKLIDNSKLSLNQLGNESLIKKGIYDISLGKQPTKNQLIMLAFTLKLCQEEREKLFNYAKEEIKNSSESNLYSFEKDNGRDMLIVHWLNNIDQLTNIAQKRNKSIVEIVNSILKESNYEVLK